MVKVRKYGEGPFNIAVVHGGPGAAGGMSAVARELCGEMGVLEPLQSAESVEGQVEELKRQLEENAERPVVLIGASWGAWLSYILAARYPEFVKKLIMVGSGPFDEKYAAGIMETRLERLEKKRKEARRLMEELGKAGVSDKNRLMARFGELVSKADTYEAVRGEKEEIECEYEVHRKVWREAAELRRSGELLTMGKEIRCPVLAIHGDYDPHPAEGVERPLSGVLRDFRFILLKNCGHEPWIEMVAREEFFRILRRELG